MRYVPEDEKCRTPICICKAIDNIRKRTSLNWNNSHNSTLTSSFKELSSWTPLTVNTDADLMHITNSEKPAKLSTHKKEKDSKRLQARLLQIEI
jgi:hypothetical protein